MSKKSAKPAGPITRRQQVAAIRQVKGQEIASAVAKNIREAVKQEVETQLKVIRDTMLSLIDRVVDIEARQNAVLMRRAKDASLLEEQEKREGDSDNRQERTEAVEVQSDAEVVQGPCHDGASSIGQD